MSLDQAEEYSATYTSRNDLITASVAQDKSDGANLTPSNNLRATAFTGGKKGYFCGPSYHRQADCPARDVSCFSSEKRGILFASAKKEHGIYQEEIREESKFFNVFTFSMSYLYSCIFWKFKFFFFGNVCTVNGIKLTALVNFLSSESYINFSTSKNLCLKIIPSNYGVQMASPAIKVKSFGFCVVDICNAKLLYSEKQYRYVDIYAKQILTLWIINDIKY